jgi:hypothetical protein
MVCSEAIALAKLRLAPSDPITSKIYEAWAAYAEDNQRNFEDAAKW